MFRVSLLFSYILLFFSYSVFANPLNHISDMVEDNNNNTFFSTDSGVYRFDGKHYLKLSDITELPNAWSKAVEFSRQKNTLYIAYSAEGVWQLNLTTQVAKKISNIYATELALNTTQLLMKSDGEIHAFEVNTQKVSNISAIEGRVLSISAYQEKSYVLTTNGAYLLIKNTARLIERVQIEKGEIQATPDGVVYSRDNVMVFYDYEQDLFRYDKTLKNPKHVTAARTNYVYLVDDNAIKKYSTIGLKAGQYKLGINNELFNDIYIDKNNKIWMLGVTDFHILDTHVKFESFNFNSKYNVFGLVNNAYWIGTRIGVYQYENGKTSTIPWLDEIMPIKDYTVQNIVQFNDHAIISTSKGAYAVNLISKTLTTRLSVDYIISASVIEGMLYLATNRFGVKIFNTEFTPVNSTEINATLPSREVLKIRKINKRLYIATAKGLWMQVDKGGQFALLDIVISDIAMVEDRLFAASYGQGLFELKQGTWQKIPSPLYIKELIAGDKLYLTTSNGMHFLNDKNYTQLMATTGKHSFTPGGVIYSGDKIYMVSHLGFVIITKTETPPIKELKLSYIKTDQHTYLNDNHIEIAQANWMDIALTDYNFYAESYVKYQYRLNNSHWHTIPTPLIQLNGVVSGEHLIEYRKSNNDVDWTEPKQFSFKVTGPWYNSDAAMLVYTLIASVLILFIVIFCWRWVLSFHRVFRSHQQEVQQIGVSDAIRELGDGIKLCESNDSIMLSEGLVKLHNSFEALWPISNNQASLGQQTLIKGLEGLKATFLSYGQKECIFDISMGNAVLDHSLECDIYSVISHAGNNALKHSKCKKLHIHLNKLSDSIVVKVSDDGVGMSFFNRKTGYFGLGHYVIKRIAKAHNTKAKWKSSKKGTSLKIEFPLKLKNEMPKSIRDMFTETE